MSTQLHNSDQETRTVPPQAGSRCEGVACQIGNCPPCLIIWGLVAAWLIINALLETFR